MFPMVAQHIRALAYVFALALNPMELKNVVVTNYIFSQNFGDLIGTLSHGQQTGLGGAVVLNNHNSPNPSGIYQFVFDDSGFGDIIGSQTSSGPGSLNTFTGSQGVGPWILTEVDDAGGQSSSITGFSLLLEPHNDLTKGLYGTVGPLGWFYDYIDVPSGATSLTISATNLPPQYRVGGSVCEIWLHPNLDRYQRIRAGGVDQQRTDGAGQLDYHQFAGAGPLLDWLVQ